MKAFINSKPLLVGIALLLATLSAFVSAPSNVSAAACSVPSQNFGIATNTLSVQSAGTYRVWTRMAAPDTTNNTYMLEIDGNTCYTVGGSGVPVYQSGSSSHFVNNSSNWIGKTTSGSFIDVTLSAGAHVVKMIGIDDGVIIDRVVASSDLSCVPTGVGQNCANPVDTTPPVVSFSSATASTTTAGQVSLVVQASDADSDIQNVKLYVDNSGTGTVYATESAAPYEFNVTGLSPGIHTFVARATNGDSLTAITTVTSVTVPDLTAPTGVSISSPSNNATVSGSITVTANASDNVAVARVEFFVDGQSKGSDTNSPWTNTINTTSLSNGAHQLTVKAFDAANNQTTSGVVAITVNNQSGNDTTPPSVAFAIPQGPNGTTPILNGKAYQIGSTITDASGIKQVEYQVDGVTKATVTSAPFTFTLDTTTLSAGTHTIQVRATDTANNTSSYVSATVRVTNIADVTSDCRVNFSDISSIIARLGATGVTNSLQDVNGDGRINFSDISGVIPKLGNIPCS